ncbi:MAG TPA: glycosyltransferase family 39 protein [Chthoniobacterales bacterium]|nr:glycosyltransferase family 39 protein [Chthoniobacterales bacterium]
MRDSPVTNAGPARTRWSLVTFFIGCVVFHILGTWSIPLIDRDEPRFAEASREMIERGDYVVPRFNNQLRLDKPPLAYWAQVASYKAFGENDFAARFPSAVAAALIAISILAWGTRLRDAAPPQDRIGSNRVGWWAAIIFTLSLQTFVHAKAAVADMWLVLFMTLAHWAGWEITVNREPQIAERKKWWWIFYISLALGFLAKGPIAWTPLLTIGAMKFFARDIEPSTSLRTGLARRFKFGRGILLMLAIVALWGVPALIQTHGEFLRIGIGRHVIGRSFSAMESHGSNSLGIYFLLLPFYFVTIFASFFPWSIKLPSLTKKLWRQHDKIDVYLICGAAVIFVIFTLIKTKLPHYTLPAFPLLALLAARHIESERFLKRAAIFAVCLYLALGLIAAPFAARFFPAKQLFQEAKQELRPEMDFGSVDFQEPSLVWYFRSRAKGWMTPLSSKKTTDFMNKDGPRFVILPAEMAEDAFPSPPPNWKTFSTTGFNLAKGKKVELTLLLKPE